METTIAYKIMETENGKIKTLFHGLNKSRTVPADVWLEANVKLGRDGSVDRWYKKGGIPYLLLRRLSLIYQGLKVELKNSVLSNVK